MTKDFILASGSPQRRELLAMIGYVPKKIATADIDESPHKKEKPSAYVKRMALEKAQKVFETNKGEVVLAADTIIKVGTKIVQKAYSDEEQEKVIRLLSGKAHYVLTAACVIGKTGKTSLKLNSTRVIMKKMSEKEIKDYVATHEWVGSSGYKIDGALACLVKKIIGSYPSIIGLPLYETKNMLDSAGVK